MSLPGKKMQIGGYNYHLSDQGKGDKVAFLVYGKTDRSVEVEHYRMMKISLILGVSILLLVTLSSAQASSVTWNFGLSSSSEYQLRGAQNVDVLGKLNNVGLFNDPSVPAMNCVNSNPSYFNKRSPVSFSYAWNYEK